MKLLIPCSRLLKSLNYPVQFSRAFASSHGKELQVCTKSSPSSRHSLQIHPFQLSYLTEDKQGIAVIGLNRGPAKNAFSRSLVDSLIEAVDVLKHDKNVRVVILRSLVQGVFCAGADLKERATMTQVETERFVNKLRTVLTQIEQLPMPTIAALDGVALGGGLEMALGR